MRIHRSFPYSYHVVVVVVVISAIVICTGIFTAATVIWLVYIAIDFVIDVDGCQKRRRLSVIIRRYGGWWKEIGNGRRDENEIVGHGRDG